MFLEQIGTLVEGAPSEIDNLAIWLYDKTGYPVISIYAPSWMTRDVDDWLEKAAKEFVEMWNRKMEVENGEL